ncbi:MAG: circadian clock protein KaiC [Candidatus Entotheonella factor]|uniref:non-specific serine/threonine protein kinase n=1 Tax=Entotheonella factor TaxID=1429438 RepID=W4LJR8_ENTF1|nr:MAG: circadian clock protein KaiC [Candidatus Entotheonella factor]
MSQRTAVEKLTTGIAGFDFISNGGLPKGRTTLLAGTAGSAKTVFAVQFLAEGIVQYQERGVFITFEESAADIRANMIGFGWDIERWEAEGMWAFVDASPQPEDESIVVGNYDLGALLARIEHAIRRVEATRVSMDSLGALFSRFDRDQLIRSELLRIAVGLKHIGVTALMTCERTADYGDISRYGIEEFVTDNVVILRNALEDEKRRRTIEILKYRGTSHQKGEFPLTVVPDAGIVVVPISSITLTQPSSLDRATSGNTQLDQMCGNGFFRNSVTLVSGATGTGKTLLTTEFLNGGLSRGERCLLFAFEESEEQIIRNAQGWGIDFKPHLEDQRLSMVCEYPEIASLEDHLVEMKEAIATFKPERVALDSLTALNRVATPKGFRDFIIGLTSFIKAQEMTGFFTVTSPTLFSTTSVTEAHFSTMTDTIIMLRYVELYGAVTRGITVLKMRGSQHSKEIREFEITASGMRIGAPVPAMTGIMAGTPIVREDSHLRDIPSQGRYIVETLNRLGACTLDQLQDETGLTSDRLEEEINLLQQQGIVLALNRDGDVHYRTTT